jgi:hypothetical protein
MPVASDAPQLNVDRARVGEDVGRSNAALLFVLADDFDRSD